VNENAVYVIWCPHLDPTNRSPIARFRLEPDKVTMDQKEADTWARSAGCSNVQRITLEPPQVDREEVKTTPAESEVLRLKVRLGWVREVSQLFWEYQGKDLVDPIVYRNAMEGMMRAIDAACDLDNPIPASLMTKVWTSLR
jgi:hypothetical protein